MGQFIVNNNAVPVNFLCCGCLFITIKAENFNFDQKYNRLLNIVIACVYSHLKDFEVRLHKILFL